MKGGRLATAFACACLGCGTLFALDELPVATDAGADAASDGTSFPTDDGDTTIDIGDPIPDASIDVDDDVAKIMFVTSVPYHADFGGASRADDSCNSLARAAGVPQSRTFVALLNHSKSLDALADAGPYYFRTGALAFKSMPAFAPAPVVLPESAPVINERGQVSDAKVVWTAWNDNDCTGWTGAGPYGGTGLAQKTDQTWLGNGNSICANTVAHRFYCFER